MALKSKIEWTENSWNPVTGCDKYSAGCKNCYAEKMANRLYAMGQAKYKNKFQVTLHEQSLNRDMVKRQNIPFLFKQWGGINKKKTGRLLDGREWLEMPKY